MLIARCFRVFAFRVVANSRLISGMNAIGSIEASCTVDCRIETRAFGTDCACSSTVQNYGEGWAAMLHKSKYCLQDSHIEDKRLYHFNFIRK